MKRNIQNSDTHIGSFQYLYHVRPLDAAEIYYYIKRADHSTELNSGEILEVSSSYLLYCAMTEAAEQPVSGVV